MNGITGRAQDDIVPTTEVVPDYIGFGWTSDQQPLQESCGANGFLSGTCAYTSVPEPSTVLLLLTGILGLVFISRRRRTATAG